MYTCMYISLTRIHCYIILHTYFEEYSQLRTNLNQIIVIQYLIRRLYMKTDHCRGALIRERSNIRLYFKVVSSQCRKLTVVQLSK